MFGESYIFELDRFLWAGRPDFAEHHTPFCVSEVC